MPTTPVNSPSTLPTHPFYRLHSNGPQPSNRSFISGAFTSLEVHQSQPLPVSRMTRLSIIIINSPTMELSLRHLFCRGRVVVLGLGQREERLLKLGPGKFGGRRRTPPNQLTRDSRSRRISKLPPNPFPTPAPRQKEPPLTATLTASGSSYAKIVAKVRFEFLSC
jgi:hypothetical protein